MSLRRITTIEQLSKFTAKLIELHGELDGKWEPDLSAQDFLVSLLDNFESTSYYFGDFDKSGVLIYFVALIPQTKERALFWLFYMNKDHRQETKELLGQLKDFMKEQGFSTVYSQSTRTESSYERWLEKFGAEKVAIIYKFKL